MGSRVGLVMVGTEQMQLVGAIQQIPWCQGTSGELARNEVQGNVHSWGSTISSQSWDQVLHQQHKLPLNVVFFLNYSVPNWKPWVFFKEKRKNTRKKNKENAHVFVKRNSVLNLLPFYMKCSRLQNCVKSVCASCTSIPVALWTI